MTINKLWVLAFLLAFGSSLGLYGQPALAANPEVVSGQPDTVPAREWLEHLESALEQTSYRGVFVYARGPEVNATRIIHRYRNGEVTERLVQLDEGGGEILRHGDEIICVLPDRGRLQLDVLLPASPFSDGFNNQQQPPSQWYRPYKVSNGEVAGFKAVIIAVSAKDPHRYSYRLWLEQDSGLLLKSQVRSREGKVLERFQFTQLEITDDISDSELKVPVSGREVRRLPVEHPAMSGSAVPDSSPGTRVPAGRQPEWMPDGFVPMTHAEDSGRYLTTYSDGVASFSVFIDPLGSTQMPIGASRIGATTAYMHKVTTGDRAYRVTVVGEIPPETAMRIAQSVRLSASSVQPDQGAGTAGSGGQAAPVKEGVADLDHHANAQAQDPAGGNSHD